MTYQTLTEFNQTGVVGIFAYVANVVPAFMPLMLFVFFLVASLGSYFAQKRLTGSADFWASTSAGSFATIIIAVVLSLTTGLINSWTLVTTIIAGVVFIAVLLFTER